MISIAICDDDISITGRIEEMLQGIAKKNFITLETEVFWNGDSLVDAIKTNAYFDIIFLDIELGEKDGITVARKIREIDSNVLIIYVTGHESYMQESFCVRPFRFLIKPIDKDKLNICFKDAIEDISKLDSYFRYSYQRISHKIPIRDILYFQSDRRKIKIVTKQNIFELYGKLNDIEKSLKISKAIFLRIHQSFLVNYKHVSGLSYDFLLLDNGKQLSISEDRRRMISEQYCSMEDMFYVGM